MAYQWGSAGDARAGLLAMRGWRRDHPGMLGRDLTQTEMELIELRLAIVDGTAPEVLAQRCRGRVLQCGSTTETATRMVKWLRAQRRVDMH